MSHILYLGPEGTHSHEAALQHFGGPLVPEQVRQEAVGALHAVDLADLGAADPADLHFDENLAVGEGGKLDLGESQSQAMNPNRIHDKVVQAFDDQYRQFDRAYHGDQAAIDAVLANPSVPESMKAKLRAGDTADADKTLSTIRQALNHRLPVLVAQLDRGTKVAFSNAITGMYRNSWVIVFSGILIVLFLPEIPLRARAKHEEPVMAAAAE